MSLLAARTARADVLGDLSGIGSAACGITGGAGKIPFICFDLSGGANIAGSNVLIGKQNGQLDFLSTAGYSKLGLPGNMTPNLASQIDQNYGLAFHIDSAFLRGMNMRAQAGTRAGTNGTIIAARSENDTGNNPHNPMYGIAKAGAKGELLTLIGSVSSDSGGNSMAPISMVDPKVRPTKVDRASDVTGLVDTGELGTLFPNPSDAVAVMESMAVLTHRKHGAVSTNPGNDPALDDAALKQFNKCGQIKSAYLAERFGNTPLDPGLDPRIVGPAGIFTQAEYNADGEFRKTAAVMKMVIDGNAGAGTIQMGGFDYHTGERATGEMRDLRAGSVHRCLPGVRSTCHPSAHDLCVQRWFAVIQWHDRQLRQWPRQGCLDGRQPGHSIVVLPGVQAWPAPHVAPSAAEPDRLVQRRWFGGDVLASRCQCGEPAGRAGAAELHEPAWAGRSVRQCFPVSRPGRQ